MSACQRRAREIQGAPFCPFWNSLQSMPANNVFGLGEGTWWHARYQYCLRSCSDFMPDLASRGGGIRPSVLHVNSICHTIIISAARCNTGDQTQVFKAIVIPPSQQEGVHAYIHPCAIET